jgi:aquaporin Z
MKKYLTEFIGTFFLILTIGQVLAAGTLLAGLAIGSVLMVMVYMGGHISGAHYNPAVTLGAWMRGKLQAGEAVGYMLVHLLGAIAAALVSWYLVDATFAPAPAGGVPQALVGEFIFTFALVLVVLNTAMSDATTGNSYYGLAIGFTLLVAVYAIGEVSGAAVNPAVATGPIIVNSIAGDGSLGDLWIYLLAPFAGGAVAALVSRVQNA